MPIQYFAKKVKDFFIYRVIGLNDTPHRIALGVAIGIFVTWTPTIGFQMLLTVALAALLRGNKVVGVPFVWISNPATLLPIYGPNYYVGCRLLRKKALDLNFLIAASSTGGWLHRVNAWWQATWRVFWPLWLGSLVVGLLLGSLAYVLTRYAVVKYRRHWHRKHDKPPWQHHEPEPAGAADGPEAKQSERPAS